MFLVGGVKSDDVAVVRKAAAAEQERLSDAAGESVPVTGVIALLSEQRTIRSQPSAGDVLVLAPRSVPRHLQALATVLGPAERTRLLRACRS
ncbi:MAG: hypothetical protein JWL64_2723, partial [Frankiales bacterium]|nr:hypothetical protein [Frankiales bacterium]